MLLNVVAQVGEELKAKVVQAAALKVKKLSKKVDGKVGVKEVERDEFDEMAEGKQQNVRQRINSGDNTKVKQRADSGGSKTKQTKLNFKPVDKKLKRNPWSDPDSDEDISGWRDSLSLFRFKFFSKVLPFMLCLIKNLSFRFCKLSCHCCSAIDVQASQDGNQQDDKVCRRHGRRRAGAAATSCPRGFAGVTSSP